MSSGYFKCMVKLTRVLICFSVQDVLGISRGIVLRFSLKSLSVEACLEVV